MNFFLADYAEFEKQILALFPNKKLAGRSSFMSFFRDEVFVDVDELTKVVIGEEIPTVSQVEATKKTVM